MIKNRKRETILVSISLLLNKIKNSENEPNFEEAYLKNLILLRQQDSNR